MIGGKYSNHKIMKLILGLVAGVGLLVAGLWYLSGMEEADPTILEVKESEWQQGPSEAKVTLVEYADFECPACAAYQPVLKDVKNIFKDELRFVYRSFPLSMHRNAFASALAAEAAGKQGKFWEMHDLLYAKQKEWSGKTAEDRGLFEKYATELGLNLDQFKADVASDELRTKVEEQKASGEDLNVRGTPTFFLNGEQLDNPNNAQAFKDLIRSKIESN